MNRELQKFIDSQADLNNDTLYKIGVKHKSIPRSERNWEELCDYLNLDKSGEQYRCWVNKRQVKDGSLMPRILMSNPLIGDTPEITAQLEALHKERIKARDAVNSQKTLLRDEARLEQFKDDIQEAVSNLKDLPKVKFTGKVDEKRKTEAVLLLSDLHLGVDCDNFYNKYNSDIAAERLAHLVAHVINYCKANNVETLNIVNLGDMIHGLIHTNARIDQQMDVISQVINASEIISEVVNELIKAAPNIVYRSCSDNHSRTVANKSENIERENFGRIIDWYLEERLKNTDVKFVNDNLDYGLGRFVLGNGKVCCFSHGHEDVLNNVFQNYVGATKSFVDYIFLGHFHTAKMKTFQNAKVFVNGSIVGTEEYALSKRFFSDPEQLLLVFDNNNVITYNINLKEV